MDQGRQAEGGHQGIITFLAVHFFFVNMALDVGRNGVLRPLPVYHRLRVKLILAGRRGEAFYRFALVHDAEGFSIFENHFGIGIHLGAIHLLRRQFFQVPVVSTRLYVEGAVFFHIIQRCQSFLSRRFRQAFGMFENILVIFVYVHTFTGPVR